MSEHRRRLAAILFVDIVGYTDRSHRDEQGALAAREWVTEIIRHRGISRGGRVVKFLGDGAVLEYVRAVEAVSAAIEIQEDVRLRESGLADPVQVRAGVHVGEVVEEGGDVLGNAVNIASRVQNISRPGGICITREVYAHIRPILRLRCKRVQVSEKHRLPDTVEVLEIDERHGATSTTLNAVRRKSSRWPLVAVIGALSLITVVSLAYGLGWISPSKADNFIGSPPVAAKQPEKNTSPPAVSAEPPNPATNGVKSADGAKGSTRETATTEVREEIPFRTVVRQDSSLPAGTIRTVAAGTPGIRRVKYQVTKVNGQVVSRRILEAVVIRPPKDRIVLRGKMAIGQTKSEPPTKTERQPVRSVDSAPKAWTCPQCGERRSPESDFCPDDGTRRPGG